MPDEVTVCEVNAVADDVPLLVVPCQYMVPPVPPLAVRITLPPHWVVPPVTVTALGVATVIVTVLHKVENPLQL